MKVPIAILAVSLGLISNTCNKSSSTSSDESLDIGEDFIELGVYVGSYSVTFSFGSENEQTSICSTELSITESEYSLDEFTYVCPPKSAGKYTLDSTTITFHDTIPHTAEFDWTLIIHGTYNYQFSDNNLQMTQLETIYTGEVRKYVYDLAKKYKF